MIKISKLADYAVVILSTLSRADHVMLSVNALSTMTHIPEPTVAKVTKLLSKAGIIESIRGSKGGYKLNKSAQDLSVLEIIEAIDGPVSLTDCVDHGPDNCTLSQSCPSIGRWEKVNNVITDALGDLSLNDMIRPQFKQQSRDQFKTNFKIETMKEERLKA